MAKSGIEVSQGVANELETSTYNAFDTPLLRGLSIITTRFASSKLLRSGR
jgi:hypothetical protein